MRILISLCLLTLFFGSCAEKKTKDWTLVPYPNSVTVQPGVFNAGDGIVVSSSDLSLDTIVSFFPIATK